MEVEQVNDSKVVRFTWKIENFTRLNTKKHYSDIFVVGGYKWQILIFPKGNNVDHLSMYLDVADSASLAYGWRRYAQFSLAVLNQTHNKYSIRKDTQHQFNIKESDWGFTSFMPLSDVYDPNRGYLVNDTVVVEAEVSVHKVVDYCSYKSKKETNNVSTLVDEEDDTTISPSPMLSASAPMATSVEASTQGLTESTAQLALTPQSIDKSISLPQPTDKPETTSTISLPKIEDIGTISLDDVDAFFQSLSSDMPVPSVPVVSVSSISTSQVSKLPKEEIEEALKQIKEALQIPPVRFDHPGRISPIEKALQTLSDLDESSGITIRQKADIVSLAEKFKTLPALANKAIKAKENLAQKETLKTTLHQNLKSSIAHFTVKKAETVQAEQEIQELKSKLEAAEKKKETLATEIKEIYGGSLLDKKELDRLNKEMPKYEEEAKAGEEEEKAVNEEWKNMMELISNISANLKFD